MSLSQFIVSSRVELEFADKEVVRKVWKSEVQRSVGTTALENYMADRVPLYYRAPQSVAADLQDGYFLRAVADTLARLPTADSFRDSHFGELLAAEFAVAAMGLRLLYSKLRLLTAENSNAYKIATLCFMTRSVIPSNLSCLR